MLVGLVLVAGGGDKGTKVQVHEHRALAPTSTRKAKSFQNGGIR